MQFYKNNEIRNLTSNKILIMTDGFKKSNPSEQDFLDAGWLPVVRPSITQVQKYGSLVVYLDRAEYEVIDLTLGDAQIKFNNLIYSISDNMMRLATAQYSPAEMSQWGTHISIAQTAQEQDAIDGTGDWSYFDIMATPGMTGKEYGTYVLAKHSYLKVFHDAVINARNQHRVAIAQSTLQDLEVYDITLYWPEQI